MALFSCCCSGPRPCVLNTSTGYAMVHAWKLDALAPPAASQPHCRYFRTLTLTVADSLGNVSATIIMRHSVEQGTVNLANDGAVNPVQPVLTITGGSPCPGAPNPNSILQQGGLSNRSETGMRVALTGINGCSFSGFVTYDFSDEISLTDMEGVAQLLASMVDWSTFPADKSQFVYHQGGIITTQQGNSTTTTGASTPNWCGNNAGLFGAAGTGSWIVYLPSFFNRPAGFDWLPLTSMTPAGNWPYLRLFGKSWNSRMIIPGSWCEYGGPMVRDSGGVPARCNISASPMTCGGATSGVQRQAGGTFTFQPTGSMRYTKIGCGIAATCA